MFLERLENFYLQVLRIVILIVASLALLFAVIAGVRSGISYFAKPDLIPERVQGEENPTFDKFLKSRPSQQMDKPGEMPITPGVPKQESAPFQTEREKIVAVIERFDREVNGISPDRTALKDQMLHVLNQFPQGIRPDYINSLVLFTSDLEKNISAAKAMKDQGKLNYDIMDGLRWHITSFKEELVRIRNKNQVAERKIAEQRAKMPFWLYTAMISFGFFLVIVFYFILVKIERNLRSIRARDEVGEEINA